uniref:G_PROTEIN_RECEP_F1_2 domain-containing protein n=1 Tax=Heligmosomoides polygyrus TaxID=6339 RepID=A0A183FMK4_HELPZ
LYAFIMLAIIIPTVIFTLMMLNQRIHGFKDLIICLPSIALCAYSFLAVTIAPARLHDEVLRSRICLIRNMSIWFPFRRNVFAIAQALSSHMEQYDLGISIWGFAILSRPLILAVRTMSSTLFSNDQGAYRRGTTLQFLHRCLYSYRFCPYLSW